jgi:sec-independent protein translocase protein TatA
MSTLFAWFGGFEGPGILILIILGILLFGKKLPEVGRYLGKSIVEFKKGVKGLEDDLGTGTGSTPAAPQEAIRPPQRVAASAPKFEDSPAATPTPPKA